MWTGESTLCPMRTRAPAGAACWAVCSDRDGRPSGPANAGVWAVHPLGAVRRSAVRSAAPLPGPGSPVYRGAGRRVLPDCGKRHVPLSAAPGGGTAPGLCAGGGPGRRGAVFLRFFGAFASFMGFLGGYAGFFVENALPSCPVGKNFLQKNTPLRKKPLLFLAQMLYNKEKWVRARKGGRQEWQSSEKHQRR